MTELTDFQQKFSAFCGSIELRFEEPQEIINDMLAGLDAEDMKKTLSIADRKEAIRTACMLAEKGDVILVAGKGHENYQEIKGVKHHFDDKEVLKEIFN